MELVKEGEDLRVRLAELFHEKHRTVDEVSTADNSRSVSESPRLNHSVLGLTNCDLNSPAASTIYLRSRSRSLSRSTNILEDRISSPLRRILPSVSSTVHRKALTTIDAHGIHAVKYRNGFTALHWAYKIGKEDVINYLLSVGADPYAKDSDGRMPYEYATPKLIGERMLRGDDTSEPPVGPKRRLADLVDLSTLREPHRKALEAIEKYGWDSLKWGGGYTILHWAYQENRKDVMEFCKVYGVPCDIRDEMGKLPVDYRKLTSN